MELGAYSFGDTPRNPDGTLRPTAEAIGNLVAEAEGKGANAIVAMRFDTSEMGGQWTEICAYGTAVKLRKA